MLACVCTIDDVALVMSVKDSDIEDVRNAVESAKYEEPLKGNNAPLCDRVISVMKKRNILFTLPKFEEM